MSINIQDIDRSDQSFEQAEKRAKCLLDLNQPNIAVFAEPSDNPSNPLISTAGINEFAENELKELSLSKTAGGIYGLTSPRNKYWEVNEFGLVYYRRILAKKKEGNYEYLSSAELVKYIVELIKKAASFYKKCGYIGNILIIARLDQVSGEKLAGMEDINKCLPIERIKRQKYISHGYADTGCLSENLVDREHLINTVDKLVTPLLQAFNIPAPSEESRELIEGVVEGRF